MTSLKSMTTPVGVALGTIGERIRKIRIVRGLSQSELARLASVTPQAINMIESGVTKSPTPDTLYSIADALETDPRELATGKGAPKSSVDQQIFQLISELPDEPKQLSLDLLQYRIEKSEGLIAKQDIARYMTWIDEIKADMNRKKKGKPR